MPALLILMAACGGKSDTDRAGDLYSQAEVLYSNGKYEEALTLLDSMDRSCPTAIDIRRKGMSLRPRLMEQAANRQLEIIDSISAIESYRLDSLSKQTQLVQNTVGNYYVSKAEGHVDVGTVSGLHGRMSPDGRIYIVATSPNPVNPASITVTSGQESASTPAVSYDGERNDRSSGKDVITFIEGECQDVAKFIYEHQGQPLTVTYNGSNGKQVSMTLPDNQKEGIATLYATSVVVRERKKQELEKQRLEKTLQTARSQIARTMDDTAAEEKD